VDAKDKKNGVVGAETISKRYRNPEKLPPFDSIMAGTTFRFQESIPIPNYYAHLVGMK